MFLTVPKKRLSIAHSAQLLQPSDSKTARWVPDPTSSGGAYVDDVIRLHLTVDRNANVSLAVRCHHARSDDHKSDHHLVDQQQHSQRQHSARMFTADGTVELHPSLGTLINADDEMGEDPYRVIERLRAEVEESQLALNLINRDRIVLYSEVSRLNDALAAATIANQDMADLMAMDDDAFVEAAAAVKSAPAPAPAAAAAPVPPAVDAKAAVSSVEPSTIGTASAATLSAAAAIGSAAPATGSKGAASAVSRFISFTGLPLLTSLLQRNSKPATPALPAAAAPAGSAAPVTVTSSAVGAPSDGGVMGEQKVADDPPTGVLITVTPSSSNSTLNHTGLTASASSSLAPTVTGTPITPRSPSPRRGPHPPPRTGRTSPHSDTGRADASPVSPRSPAPAPAAAPAAPPVWEVVYENQRRLLSGWRKTFLPTDRHEFSDDSGRVHR